jgi:S1-C subfamily serine protease
MLRVCTVVLGALAALALLANLATAHPPFPTACQDGTPAWTTYRQGARIDTIFYEKDPPKDRPARNDSVLIAGDIILEANGVPVTSPETWDKVSGEAGGKTLKLALLDAVTNKTFTVTLDLSARTQFGVKFKMVPVAVRTYRYYIGRP